MSETIKWLGDVVIWAIDPPNFIALLALLGVCWQALSTWRQNRLSVRPYLFSYTSIEIHKEGDKEISYLLLYLENCGLGPAIIEDYCIVHEGKEFRDNNIFLMLEGSIGLKWNAFFLRPKSAISANHKGWILRAEVPDGVDPIKEDLQGKLSRKYELRIKYKSLFNEGSKYSSKDHSWPFLIRVKAIWNNL